ncbi:HAD hydrolase-like protein [Paenibacillus thiaminolyticus]|uniref:HAD hydrolase-like protein n=1 Tax=Paenibacillus thiaminolyticus TaxID=49283 RepID=UPI0035A62FA5
MPSRSPRRPDIFTKTTPMKSARSPYRFCILTSPAPSLPFRAGCACRKPGIGMLLQAAAEHGLDLAGCAVIGDVGDTDIIAAHRAGALKILVRTGWGEGSLSKFKHRWPDMEPDYIAAGLWEAAQYLN